MEAHFPGLRDGRFRPTGWAGGSRVRSPHLNIATGPTDPTEVFRLFVRNPPARITSWGESDSIDGSNQSTTNL
jgi:hypothetical protein